MATIPKVRNAKTNDEYAAAFKLLIDPFPLRSCRRRTANKVSQRIAQNIEPDVATPLPHNVAILIDGAVVSAGETFVLNAMKNQKVTLFGENTGGVIDYQSVTIVNLLSCPSLGLYLGYPTSAASSRLPVGGINSTGIPPDVRIASQVRDLHERFSGPIAVCLEQSRGPLI